MAGVSVPLSPLSGLTGSLLPGGDGSRRQGPSAHLEEDLLDGPGRYARLALFETLHLAKEETSQISMNPTIKQCQCTDAYALASQTGLKVF